jgi:Tol biopolymer transport system component
MLKRSILTSLLVVLALALGAGSATASGSSGAVVFSWSHGSSEGLKGGLYAARGGHYNQLTEDPSDEQPAFSPDGRTIAFVRGGDIYAMRADGSGQHQLTSGPELDGRPIVSPNGRLVVFERRSAEGTPRDLYTVRVMGGGLHPLAATPDDDHEAAFAPDGRAVVFVRGVALAGGGVADDLYSARPSGAGLARLTHTGGLDEFAPRVLEHSVVFSRGQADEGPGSYADIYRMRRNGTRSRSLVAGVGSAYVEDVSANGRLLLFRRDQGLWLKSLARRGRSRARKLTELADQSKTNAVFSSDGRKVAAFVESEDTQTLSAIDVRTRSQADLAEGFQFRGGEGEEGAEAATIGPVIAWQPVRH